MNYDPSDALSRIDNDHALMAMLIDVYIKEIPGYISRLQSALEQDTLDLLGDAAHNVKGASAAIGFEEARSIAERIEQRCRGKLPSDKALTESDAQLLMSTLQEGQPVLKAWANTAG